jgi:hypothetical protein
VHRHVGRDLGDLVDQDVEPVGDRVMPRFDEDIAALELAPFDGGQIDRDALAGRRP